MGKKKKSKLKKRLTFLLPISTLIIIYFIFSLFFYGYNIYSLTKEKHQLEKKYQELLKEADELNLEIQKLNDEEYLARFARENYYYSKDGEYIIKLSDNLEDTNEVIKTTTFEIEKNYIVVCLFIVLLLIFAYIFRKSHSRRKK